jgi:hypothetical protein
MKRSALSAIRFYKKRISPSLPPGCRYQPTCSEYTYEAIERHGVIKGVALGVWRLVRCNPFSKGGYDSVPGTERDAGHEERPLA